jgi:curli biogenesis system outer membrane secretion channel CsgG
MKNLPLIAALLASSTVLAGEISVQENDIGAYVPSCTSPVASVAVGKFQCKAGGCQKREVTGGLVGGGALFGGHSTTKSPEMDSLASETILFATTYLVDTLAANAVVSRPALKSEPKHEQTAADTSENVFGI